MDLALGVLFHRFQINKVYNTSRSSLFKVKFSDNSTKTIRLFALDYYEVIIQLFNSFQICLRLINVWQHIKSLAENVRMQQK